MDDNQAAPGPRDPPAHREPVREAYPRSASPFRPQPPGSLLHRYVPLSRDLGTVSRATLWPDVQAGLTVTALAVPAGLAYAELAGAPAVTGLYALLLPTVVYAVLGSSRQLVIGPEGTVAALVAVALLPLATGDADRYIALTSLLAALVGVLFVLARVLRLGWIADYFSRPVLVGYVHGIAVVLIVSQLGRLSGLDIEAVDPLPQLVEFVGEAAGASLTTVTVGLVSLMALMVLAFVVPRLPTALLVVIAATAATAAFDLDAHGVATVGDVPAGLPALALPNWRLQDVVDLLPAAAAIFIVVFADGILTARSFAGKHGQHVRADQELLALGAANISAGFTQSLPVAASGSRTAVNDRSGARSQLSGLVAAAAVVVVLLFLTGLIGHLPSATLAAVIISAAIGLVEPAAWRGLGRTSRVEVLIAAATASGVVLIGVLEALVLAVGLSLADVVRRSARPHDAVLGWVDRLDRFADVRVHRSARVVPGVLVYRLDDRLFFANAGYVSGRIREAIAGAPDPVQRLVFDAEALTHVDATGVRVLRELIESLQDDGVVFLVARLKSPVGRDFAHAGLVDVIGEQHFHPTVRAAVRAAGARPAAE